MTKLHLVLLASILATTSFAQKHKIYEISAKNMSLEAVDSYPQKLLKVIIDTDSSKIVQISTFSPYEESQENLDKLSSSKFDFDRKYDRKTRQYLRNTSKVNSDSKLINEIADSLFSDEKMTMDVITKALNFTRVNIEYDEELAKEIGNGHCNTLHSDTVLTRGSGTCSEYTNVFIALMRHKNIPTRMAVGHIWDQNIGFEGTHAWAECYIDGFGWWGVDPQMGSQTITSSYFKLFHGKDFIDCKIDVLPDIFPVRVKEIKR